MHFGKNLYGEWTSRTKSRVWACHRPHCSAMLMLSKKCRRVGLYAVSFADLRGPQKDVASIPHAVCRSENKAFILFPLWFPVFKLKGGFGFIVHGDIGIKFIARIAFHAFDKVGLSFGHKAFYIGKAQRHSANNTELKPTTSLVGAFYNLVPDQ